ncbi:MAG: hypothetical protein PUC33_08710 [Oscillospiraceae bacterium]|nr:hypothetical protein [Oscillospiraceae bacterium]
MISVSDVYALLRSYESLKECSGDELMPCCERGLAWVQARLKPGTDEDDPLIGLTAAAMADFYYYIRRLSETDLYENYRAGDITIGRDPEKELKLALQRRSLAIAEAQPILEDGGFCFCGS